MRAWFAIALWKRVLSGLVLGAALGAILTQTMGGDAAAALLESYLKPVGDLFIRLIRMLIVPLILTTLVAGVVALGDEVRARIDLHLQAADVAGGSVDQDRQALADVDTVEVVDFAGRADPLFGVGGAEEAYPANGARRDRGERA